MRFVFVDTFQLKMPRGQMEKPVVFCRLDETGEDCKMHKTVLGHELPNDKIVLHGGRVVRIESYTDWNGEPFCTEMVQRLDDGSYHSAIGSPSMGAIKRGDLAEVLSPLPETRQRNFSVLFGLQNPSDDEFWKVASKVGFRKTRCDVIRQ